MLIDIHMAAPPHSDRATKIRADGMFSDAVFETFNHTDLLDSSCSNIAADCSDTFSREVIKEVDLDKLSQSSVYVKLNCRIDS